MTRTMHVTMKIISGLFLFFLSANLHAQTQAPASGKILAPAYAKAAKEKKNVIIIFHASWCGWCHKMDAAIEDPTCKPLFDANYVIAHLDIDEKTDKKHLENKGADLVRKKYHGSEETGLPFWVIVDKTGKLLGDSYIRKEGQSLDTPGQNIGCPAEDEEVAAFIVLLKKTSRLTEEQLSVIGERFKKNK